MAVQGKATFTPGKGSGTTKLTETPPPSAGGKRAEYQQAVDGFFQLAQFACISTGQFADAGAIGAHSPSISMAIADLAVTNKRVAKSIEKLTEVGPYAGLISACMPLVFQLMANHKILPADKLASAGIVKPETLEANVKTQLLTQELAAMRQEQAVQDELKEMQSQMAEQNGKSNAGEPVKDNPQA